MNAVYIHIPFCKSICSYCDFSKLYYEANLVSKYLESLAKEIAENYQGETIDTLYIGGGTPTALSISELKNLFKIINKIHLAEKYEFTIECNVEATSKEKLKLLFENKVNRLSFGIQSFNQKNLTFLERKHTKQTAIEKVKEAQKIGFNNINIDLIYALPNQTVKDLETDLNIIIDLNVQHISCYSLIIEPHTKIYNKYEDIDEDLNYKMYCLINKVLMANNFIHYEISNYAKKNFVSHHNLKYWTNQKYYGFGLSAASHTENERIVNIKNISEYLKGNYILEIEKLTRDSKIEYEIILGLRLLNGINIDELSKKYEVDVYHKYSFEKLIKKGYLIKKNNYIYVSESNLFRLNEILINLIDFNKKEEEK